MTGFVQQTLTLRDGVTVEVMAQRTSCPFLVITPSVSLNDDGSVELSGSLALTHTLTGRVVAHQEDRWQSLSDLAGELARFDWNFTDVEHFGSPQHAETLEGIREAYRAWSTEPDPEPAYLSGDSEELKAARAKDPAGTFLREHLEWWMKHRKALWDKNSKLPSFKENPQAYSAHIDTSCESFGLIYLLAVLRAIDPQIADIAARFLVVQYESGDSLGEWVYQWQDELTRQQPLTLWWIPTRDPLTDFPTPPDSKETPVNPFTIVVQPARRRFGRRAQWKWKILAGNREPIDARDTQANVGDIEDTMRALVNSGAPVFMEVHYRNHTQTRVRLR